MQDDDIFHNTIESTTSNPTSLVTQQMRTNRSKENSSFSSSGSLSSSQKAATNSRAKMPASPTTHHQSSVLWNRLVLSILITETAERVAYFGLRAVLVLYFTHGLQFSESTAVSLCAATVALAYLSPLVGAVLADSTWGRFTTIWRFGVMYAIGLICLTWAAYGVPNYDSNAAGDEENQAEEIIPATLSLERGLTFVGLFLVCTGTGGIKPCVSAFGADQVVMDDDDNDEEGDSSSSLDVVHKKVEDRFQDEDEDVVDPPISVAKEKRKEERIREFFNSFYFSINVGALGSFALIPLVRANFGFGASFLIPTISMILALSIFRCHKDQYKHRKRSDSQQSLLDVLLVSFRILQERYFRTSFAMTFSSQGLGFGHARIRGEETDDDDDEIECAASHDQVYQDASKALHILPLMAFFPIFWMLYDQQGSVWTLQATRMSLHGLEPEQLQFLNPLEIMIFIPLFDLKIYPWLEQRGFNIQPLRRMEYGMFLTAVSFAMSTVLELQIQHQPPVSVSLLWQVPQITVLTVAEILLNVTGLEFAYSQAPPNMQALILALYLFMTAIGDGLAAVLYGSVFSYLSSATAMFVCAICMLINMCYFAVVARRWKPYNQLPDTTEGLELGPVHNMEHQH